MIFVTVGTVSYPFKRLVDKSLALFKNKEEKAVIQTGEYKVKSPSKNIEAVSYLPFKQTLALYKKADLIISACGESSVYLILRHAKNKPIFVPRMKKFGEHVDDQQVSIARQLKKEGFVNIALEVSDLNKFVRIRKRNRFKVKGTNANNHSQSVLANNLRKITLAARG